MRVLIVVLMLSGLAGAQETVSAPVLVSGPKPQVVPARWVHVDQHEEYFFRAGVLCGAGASTSPVATKPTYGCGVGAALIPAPLFLEVGVMGPQANRSSLTGYVSVDVNFPLSPTRLKTSFQGLAGYSRLFETGHALDYGVAFALPRFFRRRDPGDTIRIELRDYWTFANPNQHNIMLRFGWMSEESD